MRSNIYRAGEREACKEEVVVTGLGGRQEGIMSPPKRRGVVGKRFKMDNNKRERETSFGFSTEAVVGDLGKCSFSGLRCQVVIFTRFPGGVSKHENSLGIEGSTQWRGHSYLFIT